MPKSETFPAGSENALLRAEALKTGSAFHSP